MVELEVVTVLRFLSTRYFSKYKVYLMYARIPFSSYLIISQNNAMSTKGTFTIRHFRRLVIIIIIISLY
jgi:hypothetical protein